MKAFFGNPLVLRRVHGWLTVFWIIIIPIAILLGWIYSVAFISAISIVALVLSEWSAWQSARVEVRQDIDADVQEVMDKLDEIEKGKNGSS